jgi:hypothetical protein
MHWPIRNIALGYKFWEVSAMALIFHICIPCGNTFLLVTKFLTFNSVLELRYFLLQDRFIGTKIFDHAFNLNSLWCFIQLFRNFNFDHIIKLLKIKTEVLIFPKNIPRDLVTRPFFWYHVWSLYICTCTWLVTSVSVL